MKLKEQTVYLPIEGNVFAESPDFRLTDNSKNISTYCFLEKKENQICLSKEELIELLGISYEGGFDESGEGYNGEHPSNVKEKQLYKETKEQFINQLIDNTKQ